MRKIIVLLAIAASLYNCQNDSPEIEGTPGKTTKFTGNIRVADSLNVEEVLVYAYDYLAADYEEYKATVNQKGDFSLDLPIHQAGELTAIAGNPFSFLVAPGDSVHVAIMRVAVDSTSTKMEYTFTGDRAQANQTLQSYKENFPVDVQQFYDSSDVDALDQFIAFAKANQSTLDEYHEEILKESDDPLLENYINAQGKFYFPTTKIDFANYREYYGFEAPAVDSDYYDFVQELPKFEKKDLVNTGTVQRLIYNLTYHYTNKARAAAAENDDEVKIDQQAIEMAANLKENELLSNYIIHDLYYQDLSDHNIAIYDATSDKVEQYLSDPAILKSVNEKYASEKKLLESPELPDGAELLSFQSESPEEYLNEIIANANGKVVYIDNWATWCGPCKVEFKTASPELHEKFANDVEFVYLCHSSERRAYIPSIAEFGIKGKHYFLEDEESEVISEMIKLEGFPTYTVINKAGEMVLSDYIHRPSYPETTKLLTKLINE